MYLQKLGVQWADGQKYDQSRKRPLIALIVYRKRFQNSALDIGASYAYLVNRCVSRVAINMFWPVT